MRALCRKLLRQTQQHNQTEGIAARKQARVVLDRNDVYDLRYYIVASNACFTSLGGQLVWQAERYSQLKQQFKLTRAETKQIGACAGHVMASKDAAYGSILGAFVGDAAGGVLEFMKSVSKQQVEAALRMPGGGVWKLGPGQITDDSEMAMCLLQGLLESDASGPLPLDDIASWYIRWLHSPPFDIGRTTASALTMPKKKDEAGPGVGLRMVANAAKHNQESLSNGCLMRVTPLGVWAHKQPVDVIAQHAMADAALTHPNKTAQVGTAAYCIAIAHLINHPRDAPGALAAVTAWLQQQQQQQLQQSGGTRSRPSMQESDGAAAARTVLGWLQEAQQPGPGPEVHKAMGFMRWAFVHAFRALHLQLGYQEAMEHVLLLGGDTDTNAAIVGGLVGALWGASAIPSFMTGPVLKFEGRGGPARPSFLHTRQLSLLFEQLWQAADVDMMME